MYRTTSRWVTDICCRQLASQSCQYQGFSLRKTRQIQSQSATQFTNTSSFRRSFHHSPSREQRHSVMIGVRINMADQAQASQFLDGLTRSEKRSLLSSLLRDQKVKVVSYVSRLRTDYNSNLIKYQQFIIMWSA